MPFLFLGFAVLILLVIGARAFARMKTEEAARWSRILMGLAAAIFGGLLTLRGLAVLGAPLATFGIGMMAYGAGFRQRPNRDKQNSPPTSGQISRSEALEILGLDGDPTEDEINAAYRALMKRVHPDSGGTDGLSRQLTQARDRLLNR